MFSGTLGSIPLAKVLMPLMTVSNGNLLNSLYDVTMKNTIGNVLLRFYKSEIISKFFVYNQKLSLTIIFIRKTWIGDISLKTL